MNSHYYPDKTDMSARALLVSAFERITWKTVGERRFERRLFLATTKQRYWSRESVVDLTKKLTQQIIKLPRAAVIEFVGELAGAWILCCPAELIREHDKFINGPRAHHLEAEAELVQIMLKWLDYSLDVGR
jgi:hypothetical protein